MPNNNQTLLSSYTRDLLYQLCSNVRFPNRPLRWVQPFPDNRLIPPILLNSYRIPPQHLCNSRSGPRAEERVQDSLPWLGAGKDDAPEQLHWLLRRVRARPFLLLWGYRNPPYIPRLLSDWVQVVMDELLGVLIVECPSLALAVLCCPDQMLAALGEHAAGDVWLRIWLEPHDGVVYLQFSHGLHDVSELVDVMERAAHPQRAAVLEHPEAFLHPLHIKLKELVLGEDVPLLLQCYVL